MRGAPDRRGHPVLVIDGDEDYRALLCCCVERADLRPLEAEGVEAGVRMLASRPFSAVLWGSDSDGTATLADQTADYTRVRSAAACPLLLIGAGGQFRLDQANPPEQALPRPFHPGPLVAFLRGIAVARVPRPVGQARLELAGMVIDGFERTVYRGHARTAMSRLEWALFSFLLAHEGKYVSADDLINLAWGGDPRPQEQLRGYIGRVRQRLAEIEAPLRVVSFRGRGYSLIIEAGTATA